MKPLFTHRCTWCAVETSETIEESKELPIRWGANTSTKVLPSRIRRGIRRVPRYNCSANFRCCSIKIRASSSQRQLESKFRRIMKLTRTTTLPTGSVAFICISRRETIVRAFGAQHALENPYHFGMCRIDEARKSGYRVSLTYHTLFQRERERWWTELYDMT